MPSRQSGVIGEEGKRQSPSRTHPVPFQERSGIHLRKEKPALDGGRFITAALAGSPVALLGSPVALLALAPWPAELPLAELLALTRLLAE